jgi:WD40 repeat protein
MIEGKVERDGKKKVMPPGKRKKLEASEIDTIKKWIAAGARPPAQPLAKATEISVPKIVPKLAPRRPVNALAYAPSPQLIAVGRYGEIELLAAESRHVTRTLTGHRGNVNAIVFSADRSSALERAARPACLGKFANGKSLMGLYCARSKRIMPFMRWLFRPTENAGAGSYDQKIKLWNA